jgi:hypothetical protein
LKGGAFNVWASRGTEPRAVDALASDPSDSLASTAEEDGFFARGLLEEQATLDSLSRRPPGAAPNALRGRSKLVGALAIGTATLGLLIASRPPSDAPSVASPRPPIASPVTPAAATIAPPSPAAVEPPAPASPAPDAATRCRAAVRAKRFREMLDVCDAAARAPEGADLALLVANAELEHGRAASAQRWARLAVDGDPRLAEAYVIIGSVEQQAGHRAAAHDAYARYLALAPKGRYAADLRAISRGW